MPATGHRVKFADFEFDQQSGELFRDGARVVLPNQPCRILAALVGRPGAVVTREELRRELWAEDTFVDFEHSLNAGMKRLREAIGDSATSPRYIETVPQRGYRFIGGVEERTDTRRLWLILPAIVAAVAIAVIVLQLRPRTLPKETLVRLTSTSGINTDPALSPDGTLLAFASDRAGADSDIYVQPVAGGEPTRLTNDPADELEPSFSPDGARIVFSRRGAGLYLVGALGGEPRLIVRAPVARTPRFSPDGRWIAYWTGFPASVVSGGIPGALASMFIVPAEGGSPRELKTGLASARYPTWSPDGERLLFLGEENADRKMHDWYVIPREGGAAIKTGTVAALHAAGLKGALPIPGTWSARNDEVIFATNETDSSNVWQIPVSSRTGRVSGPAERLTFGTAVERNPMIAASGRIVFTSILENVDIWRVPLDPKTGEASGPLERLTDDAATDTLRSVSSDGSTMFFISSRTGRDEVWTKDLHSGHERQLTHGGVEEASATADGTRVAYSTIDEGRHEIEIVGTSDGVPSKLCEGCDAPAGWSRDGTRLLYGSGAPSRVVVYDFTSNRRTELASHPTWSLERPKFSPDGQWVTFYTANSPNVRQIYSAPIGSGGAIPQGSWIPLVTDHGCHASWSPDGTLLYYFSSRDGAFCPWVQRIEPATKRPAGAPAAVLHLHHPRLRAASGAAAFNDVQAGYLYMTLTEATGNVWMIDKEAAKR